MLEVEKPTALFIQAHPDDHVLWTATIHNLIQSGARVVFTTVTAGEKGRPNESYTEDYMRKKRLTESFAAAQVLRAEFFLPEKLFPDFEVQQHFSPVKQSLVALMRVLAPAAVYTFHPEAKEVWHPDHKWLGLAVQDAAAAVDIFGILDEQKHPRVKCPVVYQWSPPEPITPQLVVRHTPESWNLRLLLLNAYASQFLVERKAWNRVFRTIEGMAATRMGAREYTDRYELWDRLDLC